MALKTSFLGCNNSRFLKSTVAMVEIIKTVDIVDNIYHLDTKDIVNTTYPSQVLIFNFL